MSFLEATGLMFWIVLGMYLLFGLAIIGRDLWRKFKKWLKT